MQLAMNNMLTIFDIFNNDYECVVAEEVNGIGASKQLFPDSSPAAGLYRRHLAGRDGVSDACDGSGCGDGGDGGGGGGGGGGGDGGGGGGPAVRSGDSAIDDTKARFVRLMASKAYMRGEGSCYRVGGVPIAG